MNMKWFRVLVLSIAMVAMTTIGCGKLKSTSERSNQKIVEDTSNDTSSTGNVKKTNTAGKTTLTTEQKVEKLLSHMTLEEKIYQMFIITPEALTGYTTVTKAGTATKTALTKYPVGGLIYFSKNLVGPAQVTALTTNTQKYATQIEGVPIFLCIDEEGGTVARLGNNKAFSVKQVGNMSKITTKKAAYQVGDTIGTYLNKYGFNFDFAPDADVLTNSKNTVIGNRSFGSDPKKVTNLATQVSKGLQSHGIMTTFKHFPGHGATTGDTHEGYAVVNKTYDQMKDNELLPFFSAQKAGVDVVMVAHISAPKLTGSQVPCSLSKKAIVGILRNKCGYKGLVVTDALNMGAVAEHYTSAQAAVKAVKAGNDLLLMPADFGEAYNAVLKAVKNGSITEARINQSVRRILTAKVNLN